MSKADRPRSGLDTILIEEIGQFGKFQLRNIAYSCVVAVTVGWTINEYIFTAARITTRCAIPECDSASPQFSPPWLVNAVPAAGSSFDNCQRFANNTNTTAAEGTCPSQLFDTDILVKCEQYVYQNNDTVVYDFNLGCNDWLRSMIGSIRKVGSLTSLPITGYISDRWGRRAALCFNAVNTVWLGTIRYWTETYAAFVTSVFIESNFGAGLYSCLYILMVELVGPKYRVVTGVIVKTGYTVGQAISVAYFWIFSESILWYMSKGRFEKSEQLITKIAQTNGKQVSQKSLDALRMSVEQERKDKESLKDQKASEPWLIVEVLRHRKVLVACLVSPVWWITGTLIYYGLTINAVNLSGNRYVNYAAVAAAEVPGFWTAALLLDRLGRKPVFITAYWVCAACQFAYVLTPTDQYAVSLAMFLLGNYCIAIVMTTVYVYTTELYPTRYRHRLFAFSSMLGRLGSIVAPLTPSIAAAVWDKLPFVMFGSLAVLSGLLAFLTPETLGSKLPETMADAEAIGNRNNDEN